MKSQLKLLGTGHIGNNILVPVSHEGTHWSKKVEVEVEVEVEVRVTASPRFRESLPLGLVTRRDNRTCDVNIVPNSM